QISGWAHTAGQSVFTCGQAGVYLIQYAGVTETTSGGATNSLRVVLNSTEIPGSQSVGTTSLALSPITVGKSVLAALNVADQIKVQFTSGSTTGALVTNNGSGTTRPSISVTIIRIQ
ncbi:MAG TPA: hypothetical protein VG347_07290, partial [Verrucomicrobiae bacterium]|nr:hypothetical protein [Verrucomicrobiae bacterium]